MLSSGFFPNWKFPSKNIAKIVLKIFFLGPEGFLVEQSLVAASSACFVATAESVEIYQLPQRWREMARWAFGTPLWSKPFRCAASPVLETRTVPGWCRGVGLVPIHSWVEATAEVGPTPEKTQSAGEMAPNGANREWILLPKFDCHHFGNRTCEWTQNGWFHPTEKCDRIVQKEKIEFHRHDAKGQKKARVVHVFR